MKTHHEKFSSSDIPETHEQNCMAAAKKCQEYYEQNHKGIHESPPPNEE